MTDSLWDFADSQQWMERTTRFPPLIITCAVNGGIQGKESHPALPELPREIAEQAQQAYEAGASVVHIHGRDAHNFTDCAEDPDVYREINGLVREKCPDMIINNTTGGGPTTTMEARIACLDALPEMASLNLGPTWSASSWRPASRRWPTRARPCSSTCACRSPMASSMSLPT